jgi:L-cysteine S-thiosulfotransferase
MQMRGCNEDTRTQVLPDRLRLSMGRLVVLGVVGAVLWAAALALPGAETSPRPDDGAPLAIDIDAAARPWVRYARWPTRDAARFNTLAALASPQAPTAPRPLSGPVVGDPALGAKLVADRGRGGSCLACHVMGSAGAADLPGNVGPDLSEIGNAGRDDAWLFNYVYDARAYVPQTLMPPWGSHGIFSDQEIGHIVAFLKTLRAPARFKDALDDPDKRPPVVEKRDNLDSMINPAMWTIDSEAPELWTEPGARGASCATCHAAPEQAFKTWAASMPRWEPRLDKVLGIEEFVARHARVTTGHAWLMQSEENTALAVYLRYLANGTLINVDIEGAPSKAAYERGRELTLRKLGQLNFACADCHLPERAALKWIRGQWLAEMKGQLDHFPTWRTSQQAIWDVRRRFQWCQVAIWAHELPPDAKEYGDLELYLIAQSNGLKLNVPGIRH